MATARHECLSAAPTRALRVPAHLRCLVAAHAILDAVEEDRRLRREHCRAELLAQEIRGDPHCSLGGVNDVSLRQVRRPCLRQRLDEVAGTLARFRLVARVAFFFPTPSCLILRNWLQVGGWVGGLGV